jgi:hypothetical protein
MIVPVGPHEVGEHLGIARIGLGSRGRVAIPIVRRRHRVDRIDLVAGRQQRIDDQATVDLDAHGYRFFVIAGVLGHQRMKIAGPGHAVGNPRFAKHLSALGHHAHVVMDLGPVHSYKEQHSSSRS